MLRLEAFQKLKKKNWTVWSLIQWPGKTKGILRLIFFKYTLSLTPGTVALAEKWGHLPEVNSVWQFWDQMASPKTVVLLWGVTLSRPVSNLAWSHCSNCVVSVSDWSVASLITFTAEQQITGQWGWNRTKVHVFKRRGVAGAVLQTVLYLGN